MDEMQHIANAIEHANQNGLLVEFVYTYGHSMGSGSSVSEAINDAFREWDL